MTIGTLQLNGAWELIEQPLAAGAEAVEQVRAAVADLAASVPGDVNDALVRSGRLPEPLIGLNFEKFAFVQERSWWWRKRIDVPAAFADAAEVELSLDGLDVHGDVWLNGIYLGHQASAFYPFTGSVADTLRPGEANELVVRLTCGRERVSQENLGSVLASMVTNEADRGYPERGSGGRIWLRKPAYVWGWDWSPHLPTCGITGPAELRAHGVTEISDVALHTTLDNGVATIHATVEIERRSSTSSTRADVQLAMTDADGRTVNESIAGVSIASGVNYVELAIVVPAARLWWPNGSGEPHLYDVRATVQCTDGTTAHRGCRYGVRTVRLIDKPGRFGVEINGVPIFLKGGNWIPPDSLYGRVTAEKLTRLVDEAAEANFNVLRVWGGGRYELDAFYDACDRRGVLLWHDFMSACAFLPGDEPWFEREVEREAAFQIRRLRSRACILLFCGNNEVGQFCELHKPGVDRIWEPGWALYHRLMPRLVRQLCPHVPYRPTSPYGGATSVLESQEGDSHHWIVMRPDSSLWSWPEHWDSDEVPIFNSEYGYGGPACRTSTCQYLGSDTPDLTGRMARQHTNTFYDRPRVEHSIAEQYGKTMPMPLDRYILLGGMCQGLNLGYSLESQRANRQTNGAIFWMYDDAWGENGWTIIDYYLRRKIAYYHVRRCLAPRRLVLRAGGQAFGGQEGEILLIVLNDGPEPLRCGCQVGFLSYDGQRRELQTVELHVPARTKATVARLPCPDAARLEHGTLVAIPDDEHGLEPVSWRHRRFKHMSLPAPKIHLESVRQDGDTMAVVLQADTFAHGVHLGLNDDTRPDDAYFDLLPGQRKIIRVPGESLVGPPVDVRCIESGP